jgi:hypothetical protein
VLKGPESEKIKRKSQYAFVRFTRKSITFGLHRLYRSGTNRTQMYFVLIVNDIPQDMGCVIYSGDIKEALVLPLHFTGAEARWFYAQQALQIRTPITKSEF